MLVTNVVFHDKPRHLYQDKQTGEETYVFYAQVFGWHGGAPGGTLVACHIPVTVLTECFGTPNPQGHYDSLYLINKAHIQAAAKARIEQVTKPEIGILPAPYTATPHYKIPLSHDDFDCEGGAT